MHNKNWLAIVDGILFINVETQSISISENLNDLFVCDFFISHTRNLCLFESNRIIIVFVFLLFLSSSHTCISTNQAAMMDHQKVD